MSIWTDDLFKKKYFWIGGHPRDYRAGKLFAHLQLN
jgi:hypothetical protein